MSSNYFTKYLLTSFLMILLVSFDSDSIQAEEDLLARGSVGRGGEKGNVHRGNPGRGADELHRGAPVKGTDELRRGLGEPHRNVPAADLRKTPGEELRYDPQNKNKRNVPVIVPVSPMYIPPPAYIDDDDDGDDGDDDGDDDDDDDDDDGTNNNNNNNNNNGS